MNIHNDKVKYIIDMQNTIHLTLLFKIPIIYCVNIITHK